MIFVDPDDEQYDLLYLGEYHPFWINRMAQERNPDFDDYSSEILNLKKSFPEAIAFFADCVDAILAPGVALVVVPSHDPAKAESGVRQVARRLAAHKNRVDATGCLVRHTKIAKLSEGGERSVQVHLDSLRVVNRELILGREVLLLDDVTTSGHSLEAAAALLRQAGVRVVKCVALAKTVRSTRYESMLGDSPFA